MANLNSEQRETVLSSIRSIEERNGTNPEGITEETNLPDLQWDSLDFIEVIMEVEKDLKTDVKNEEGFFMYDGTVKDVIDFVSDNNSLT